MNYFVIMHWMTDEDGLCLSGNELLVYAIIYGFSQDGGVCFAKRDYFAKMIGISRKATITGIIQRLTEKGYVVQEGNGYRAVVPGELTACTESTETVPKSTESVPYEESTESVHKGTETVPQSTESVPQEYGKRTHIINIYNKYILKYIKEGKGENDNELMQMIQRWFDYRTEIKKPVKSYQTAKMFIDKIIQADKEFGRAEVLKTMEYSIDNGYTGFFFDRMKKSSSDTVPRASYDSSKYSKLGLNLAHKDFDILSD